MPIFRRNESQLEKKPEPPQCMDKFLPIVLQFCNRYVEPTPGCGQLHVLEAATDKFELLALVHYTTSVPQGLRKWLMLWSIGRSGLNREELARIRSK